MTDTQGEDQKVNIDTCSKFAREELEKEWKHLPQNQKDQFDNEFEIFANKMIGFFSSV